MPPRVCVIGSANVDYTMTVGRFPCPGETVGGGELLVNLGGKGANQAVTARKLGADVRMIGCVGADPPGRETRRRLGALGIGVDGLFESDRAATGTALILVDREGRNQIAVALGANDLLSVDMTAAREESIGWADVLLCQLEIPLAVVAWALGRARARGVTTVLNPAPVAPVPDSLLASVDYLTPNTGEAAALGGEPIEHPFAEHVAARLVARGVRTAIVTLGQDGAVACDGVRTLRIPAFPVDVVDTTAAGDAFSGALAVGLAGGGALEQAIALANAAAALTCTRRGAQDSLPDRAEVDRFLRSQPT